MKRLTAFLLSMIVLLPLAGCASSQGFTVRFDIDGPVDNLDPQFSTDDNARMILANIYEGLLVYEPATGIVPGAAQSYEVSGDGLTYTFTLREGACWADGTPITSDDFLFTFERLFNRDAPSPHAVDYSCIQNASQVLAGTMDYTQLGISAPDERTVIFTLEYASPNFLRMLAATPATPCNRAAFRESRGRYGLDAEFVYSNGPFTLHRWNNDSAIQLRQNAAYVSDTPVLAAGVTLYIDRTNPAQQFLNGKSDLTIVPFEQASAFADKSSGFQSFENTTWCIVFNQSDPVLGNPLIRQSLAYTLDTNHLRDFIEGNLTATRDLIPPSISLDGVSYRERAGSSASISFDRQRGEYLYQLGISALELEQLPSLTLLVPDTGEHYQYAGELQQDWQKYLGIYVQLEVTSLAELEKRLQSGKYQMALTPLVPSSDYADSILSLFSTSDDQVFTGYHNSRYDSFISQGVRAVTVQQAVDSFSMAEKLLLSDVVVLPLYNETTIYATADKVSGIQVAPFSGYVYFKYAQKS